MDHLGGLKDRLPLAGKTAEFSKFAPVLINWKLENSVFGSHNIEKRLL